jgi:hypothetical protein
VSVGLCGFGRLRAGSAPVGRTVVEETVVVGVVGLAPAAIGVVAGLVGQHNRLFRLEVDLALGVVIAFGLVQDVHD